MANRPEGPANASAGQRRPERAESGGGGAGEGVELRLRPRGRLRPAPARIGGRMALASAAARRGGGARNLLQFLRLVGQLKVSGRSWQAGPRAG